MNDKTSAFNAAAFMQTTVNEGNSTEVILLPEGEYVAVSGPINEDSFKSFDIKEGARAGEKFYRLDLIWDLEDSDGRLAEYLGRKPTARQSIGLDLTREGGIEMGKGRNVSLGRLREALGQNASGRPWSPVQLGGQAAKIKVKHRMDKKNGQTYVEVVEVAHI